MAVGPGEGSDLLEFILPVAGRRLSRTMRPFLTPTLANTQERGRAIMAENPLKQTYCERLRTSVNSSSRLCMAEVGGSNPLGSTSKMWRFAGKRQRVGLKDV